MGSLLAVLRRAHVARALSLRVALAAFVPYPLASQILRDAVDVGGPLWAWLLLAVAGEAVIVAAFVVLRAILQPLFRDGRRARLELPAILVAYAIAGAAHGGFVGWAVRAAGLHGEFDVGYRIGGGAVFGVVVFAVIAYAFTLRDEHLALVTELEGRRSALLEVRATMAERLARAEGEVGGAVRAALEPGLRTLEEALGRVAGGDPAGGAVRVITELVELELRPFSHRLAAGAEDLGAGSPPLVATAGPVSIPLPDRMAVAAGIAPIAAMTLLLAAGAPSALADLGPASAARYLVGMAIWLFVGFAAVRRLGRSIVLPTPVMVATVMLVHVGLVVSGGLIFYAAGVDVPPRIRFAGVLVSAAIGFLSAAGALVVARRGATEESLRSTVAELEESVALIRRRAVLARRRVAYVLHGSVQSAFHAAALRLAEADEPDAALVEAVRGEVRAAFELIEDVGAIPTAHGVETALAEIARTWGPSRAIAYRIEPPAAEALARDRDAETAVVEVVGEAVGNAIRHGRARSVDVAISRGPASVEIAVHDDGVGWDADLPAGMGTALFDELCRAWGHATDASGTTFTGSIALV